MAWCAAAAGAGLASSGLAEVVAATDAAIELFGAGAAVTVATGAVAALALATGAAADFFSNSASRCCKAAIWLSFMVSSCWLSFWIFSRSAMRDFRSLTSVLRAATTSAALAPILASNWNKCAKEGRALP